MPAKGAEYALLQKRYQLENIQKTVASYRERARERERYIQASKRNSLEHQRANISNSLDRLLAPTRIYYLGQLMNLNHRIAFEQVYPFIGSNLIRAVFYF